jgi:hypothetical protein
MDRQTYLNQAVTQAVAKFQAAENIMANLKEQMKTARAEAKAAMAELKVATGLADQSQRVAAASSASSR